MPQSSCSSCSILTFEPMLDSEPVILDDYTKSNRCFGRMSDGVEDAEQSKSEVVPRFGTTATAR